MIDESNWLMNKTAIDEYSKLINIFSQLTNIVLKTLEVIYE